jgi:hypothetical protein
MKLKTKQEMKHQVKFIKKHMHNSLEAHKLEEEEENLSLQRNLKQNKKPKVLTMKYDTTSVMRSLQQRCQVPKGDYDKISLNLQ